MLVDCAPNYCIRAFQKKQQLILLEVLSFYLLLKISMCYIIGLILRWLRFGANKLAVGAENSTNFACEVNLNGVEGTSPAHF